MMAVYIRESISRFFLEFAKRHVLFSWVRRLDRTLRETKFLGCIIIFFEGVFNRDFTIPTGFLQKHGLLEVFIGLSNCLSIETPPSQVAKIHFFFIISNFTLLKND